MKKILLLAMAMAVITSVNAATTRHILKPTSKHCDVITYCTDGTCNVFVRIDGDEYGAPVVTKTEPVSVSWHDDGINGIVRLYDAQRKLIKIERGSNDPQAFKSPNFHAPCFK